MEHTKDIMFSISGRDKESFLNIQGILTLVSGKQEKNTVKAFGLIRMAKVIMDSGSTARLKA